MNIKEPQFRTITTPNAEELLRYRAMMEDHITEQHAGKEWAVVSIKDHAITLQELVRVRPSGMQYAVLQGRMPQDGSKPDTALILFPAWVSATLLCAGICGRVIELTDGSIIEGAVLPHDGTEQDLLEEIRSELGGPQQRVTDPTPAAPAPYVAPVVNADQIREDAYREGMQADRNNLIKALADKGYVKPDNLGLGEWLRAAMEAYQNAEQKPQHENVLSDERIDAIAEAMPGGVLGFMKDWGYRQFAREVQRQTVAVQATPTNYTEQAYEEAMNELVEREQEIDRLRTLLAGIRRMAKKGKA